MVFESSAEALARAPVHDGKWPGRIVSLRGRRIMIAPRTKACCGEKNCENIRVAIVQIIGVLNPIYPLRVGGFKVFTI